MKRRTFVLGVGAASVGSAGVIGTGAISSITADREVQLRISRDDRAYLEFVPLSTLSELDRQGFLVVDLTEFNDAGAGEGFNRRSEYEVVSIEGDAAEGIFAVKNGSDRPVEVASTTVGDIADVEKSTEPGDLDYESLDEADPRVELFDVDDDDRTAIDDEHPRTLEVGQQLLLGLRIIVPEDTALGSRTIDQVIQAIER